MLGNLKIAQIVSVIFIIAGIVIIIRNIIMANKNKFVNLYNKVE